MPTVYVVRHGDTDFNGEVKGGGGKRARGWLDIPLNEKGQQHAREAGAFLADKEIKYVFASDLPRTQQTAVHVANAVGTGYTPMYGLRPWNIGNLQGQRIEDCIPEFQAHILKPNLPVEGGESYGAFYARWKRTLWRLIRYACRQQANIAIVTHSRNLYSLAHILTGGKSPIRVDGPPQPGGILALDAQDLTFKIVH